MDRQREDYVPPVGFAREPAKERWRWIGRVLLAAFMVLILWVVVNRVLKPPTDNSPGPIPQQSVLPGD